MAEITKEQRHILRHALGLTRGDETYRNHFVTGEGSDNYDDCCALVDAGLMTRFKGNELTGGGDLFVATASGMEAALEKDDVEQS